MSTAGATVRLEHKTPTVSQSSWNMSVTSINSHYSSRHASSRMCWFGAMGLFIGEL